MSELFNNIKMLKLYGWESIFLKRIDDVRTQESKLNRNIIKRVAFTNGLQSLTR